ncbi:MAG: ATP-dependent Clp protease ATP-binding subunit [Bacillota bacterium]|nr:ATP-dependent Clp protease ATP-binding subunit [Bacillota bacterium]
MKKCSICGKNTAIVMITKMEADGSRKFESICMECAKNLGISPLDEMMKQVDLSEEDLNNISDQLMSIMNDVDMDEVQANPLFKMMMGDMGGDSPASEYEEKELEAEFEDPALEEGMEPEYDMLAEEEESAEDAEEREKEGESKKFSDFMKSFGLGSFASSSGASGPSDSGGKKSGVKADSKHKKKYKTLEKYGENLNDRALNGKIDKVVGRDLEIERVIQILARRSKNNPVLIGEPGVGKTAIAQGLALRIVEGEVPEKIKKLKIFLLDLTAIVAGTQFRGQFESRMKGIINEAKAAGDVVLVIDEIHNIVGAGEVVGGIMNAGNILKPALADGSIQLIGATTLEEYRKHIEKDSALERRFQKVMVDEPSIADSIEILKGIKHYYEEYHSVSIPDEVCSSAVVLADRYINDRFLPDKAIDLIDEAGAMLNLKNVDFTELKELNEELMLVITKKEEASISDNFEEAAKYKTKEIHLRNAIEEVKKRMSEFRMSKEDIAKVIEMWTSIPVTQISEEEADKLIKLEEQLHLRVVGQSDAVESVAKAVRRRRAGFKSKKRPASFIFVGPTGVGKTELSKALAQELFGNENAIIRLDMSEYMEKHTVSKLVGAPPGYVGYDNGGQLTERIRRKPYSVVLFDEIEKAHPDVFNMLLQILDDGRLTDAQGRTVYFEHSVIIMTSNAGTSHKAAEIGFQNLDKSNLKVQVESALKEFFRPEFLGRVDDIVIFERLGRNELAKIVDIQLKEVHEDCAEKLIQLNITQGVKDRLIEVGYDEKYGARPLRKKIQSLIEDEIAELYLRGRLKTGSVLNVKLNTNGEGNFVFEII